jgi:hypothetical protein
MGSIVQIGHLAAYIIGGVVAFLLLLLGILKLRNRNLR